MKRKAEIERQDIPSIHPNFYKSTRRLFGDSIFALPLEIFTHVIPFLPLNDKRSLLVSSQAIYQQLFPIFKLEFFEAYVKNLKRKFKDFRLKILKSNPSIPVIDLRSFCVLCSCIAWEYKWKSKFSVDQKEILIKKQNEIVQDNYKLYMENGDLFYSLEETNFVFLSGNSILSKKLNPFYENLEKFTSFFGITWEKQVIVKFLEENQERDSTFTWFFGRQEHIEVYGFFEMRFFADTPLF